MSGNRVKQLRVRIGQLPWRRWLVNRGVSLAATAFLCYALAGFFLVPWLVNRYLPRYVAEQLHHQLSYSRLRINPLLFTAEVRDFQLADAAGKPLAAFARLAVDLELESLLRWGVTFDDIILEKPTLHLLIGKDGHLNLARFLAMLPKGEEPPPDAKPVRLLLKHVAISGGAVHFSDDSGPVPVRTTLAAVAIELRGISTLPERNGAYAVTALLPGGGKLGWQGEASLVPIASHGTLAIDGFHPAALWKFLPERLNLAAPDSVARLKLDYRFAHQQGKTTLVVNPLDFAVQGLVVREKGQAESLLRLEKLAATKGRFDLQARQLVFPVISLRGLHLAASRDRNGVLNWKRLPLPGKDEQGKGQAPVGEGGKPGSAAGAASRTAWRFAVKRLELADGALDFTDHGIQPALTYGLRDLGLTGEGFDTAGREPLRVAAKAKVAQGGSLEVAGSLAQNGKEAEGQVRISGLDLRPLDPLLGKRTLLRLAAGDFSLDGSLSYRAGEAGPMLTASGNAAINRLLLTLRKSGRRFLAWQELAASGIDLGLGPDRLAIQEVRLVAPETRIVIFKNRTTNLARIFKAQAAPSQPLPAGSEAAPPAEKRFPFTIGRVRLEKGVVDFADRSLVLPFAARIEKFRGTAFNIADDPASRTTLKFDGQVGAFGLAKVDGALAPMAPKRFTDIKVLFRNVELPPLSPYTATFAGRRIASGRLDLDLGYRIEKSELVGDNRVLLKNFTLGERVESPGALKLPLDLAIALLTDSQGRIDVAVPVRGNVDHPEFSYGHLIWQAVRNILSRIATAPFRALGSLLGFGSEEADTVLFAPGQSEVAPPEREKLYKVAEILDQREKLLLTVHGTFARDLDGAVIVRRAVAKRLGVILAPEDDPPVAFAQAKTQRALETLAGSAALDAFQVEYEKRSGRKVRRVNPVLGMVGRGSGEPDFYQALFEHLVQTAPFVAQELHELAARRRAAMIQELVVATGLAPESVAAGGTEEATGQEGAVPVRMELGTRR
ncbi:MAG: DUF748 domain-containing protein [Thermodesulfobacteriota bacterium]